MSPTLSYKMLVFGYGLLTALYLFAFVNNALDNFAGNRTLGAGAALAYFVFMVTGLVWLRRIFSIISSLNFIIGSGIAGYFMYRGLPHINMFFGTVFLVGLLGTFLSLNSARVGGDL